MNSAEVSLAYASLHGSDCIDKEAETSKPIVHTKDATERISIYLAHVGAQASLLAMVEAHVEHISSAQCTKPQDEQSPLSQTA